MLDYDDAYSCPLSNAIRSFNWGACGHALKRTDTEVGTSDEIVLRTPSWNLIPKRDDSETFVYKTVSSVAVIERDVREINSFCSDSPDEARFRQNEFGHIADDKEDCDISDNLVTSRKKQKVGAGKSLNDDAIAVQRSETIKKRQVEPCQMIILLDIRISSGKLAFSF
jgi:hypothetical protein